MTIETFLFQTLIPCVFTAVIVFFIIAIKAGGKINKLHKIRIEREQHIIKSATEQMLHMTLAFSKENAQIRQDERNNVIKFMNDRQRQIEQAMEKAKNDHGKEIEMDEEYQKLVGRSDELETVIDFIFDVNKKYGPQEQEDHTHPENKENKEQNKQ